MPLLLKNISPTGWDGHSQFKWHVSPFSRNNPRQGHSSSWSRTRELWEIRHRCRRQLFGMCPPLAAHRWRVGTGGVRFTGPYGCEREARETRWLWQGLCKMWLLAATLKILLLLLCFICLLCNPDENLTLWCAFRKYKSIKRVSGFSKHMLHSLVVFCMLRTKWNCCKKKGFRKTDGATLCTQGGWRLEITVYMSCSQYGGRNTSYATNIYTETGTNTEADVSIRQDLPTTCRHPPAHQDLPSHPTQREEEVKGGRGRERENRT